MSVALANALRKGCFAYMNEEKAHNVHRADRMERQITSYCQDVATADELVTVAKQTTRGGKCVDALSNAMKSRTSTSKLLEWGGKAANFASKAVNPILCVASLSRALSAEDKKSAGIQEAGAMLGMFAFEGVAKSAMGLAPVKNKFYNAVAGKLVNGLKATKLINKLPNNKFTAILKGLAFVAASCIGFSAGHGVGKLITKNTTEKDFQMKKMMKEQEQLAQLTAAQQGTKTNVLG